VTEDGLGNIDEVRSSIQIKSISGVENYTFTGNKAVFFIGDGQQDNWIIGTNFNDTLAGDGALPGGADTINGGKGADLMGADVGNDLYYVDNAKDVIDETGALSIDTVRSTISYSLTENGVTVRGNLEILELIGTAAINGTGSVGEDKISGNDAANKIFGLDADDTPGAMAATIRSRAIKATAWPAARERQLPRRQCRRQRDRTGRRRHRQHRQLDRFRSDCRQQC
jgi:hypothetical protein